MLVAYNPQSSLSYYTLQSQSVADYTCSFFSLKCGSYKVNMDFSLYNILICLSTYFL
ncbi:hypothetical protein HanHA300_Chr07g0238351 [Helianthus annuus]|nr:hypothetical protein HanHA300_Chr07g0238351 [Helianthus annuus]KAJ0562777.1 hypothetical protein HanHA89_Chr07g0255531 [Helianthus annuus]KAJ0730922.1 hypothetical protein HanOQP8_Chr07g0245981 [Helianthus annuus]